MTERHAHEDQRGNFGNQNQHERHDEFEHRFRLGGRTEADRFKRAGNVVVSSVLLLEGSEH